MKELEALIATPVEELLPAARKIREQGSGVLVTYSPKVFIPLTKLCRDVCHYCTFAQPPRRGERAYLTADEVLAIAAAGAEAGCHEALFTLGDKPELRYRAAREELAAARLRDHDRLPGGDVPCSSSTRPACSRTPTQGCMSRDELGSSATSRPRRGSCSRRSRIDSPSEVGRISAPPTRCRQHGSRPFGLAGELAIPFTTGILIGIGETRHERLEALARDPRAARALRPHPGGDRPELPGQARDADGRPSGALARRAAVDGRGRPDRPRPGDEPPGAAEPVVRGLPEAARRGTERLGRHLAGHDRPRQPRGSVAGGRSTCGSDSRSGTRARFRGSPSTRSTWPTSAAGARPGSRPRSCIGPTRRGSPARIAGLPAPLAMPRGLSSGHVPARRRLRRSRPLSPRARQGVELDEDERDGALRGSRIVASTPSAPPPTTCGARSTATPSPTSSPATSTTRTSATSAAASAPSRRGSSPRTSAGRPMSSRSRRSSAGAARPGIAAPSRYVCRGASTPLSPARSTSRSARRSSASCPTSTSTRSRRSRSGRARRRSARPSTTTSPGSVTSALPPCPGRPRRSSTTRCAASSAPTRCRPGSGSRCTTPPTAPACARRPRSCTAPSRGRAAGRATCSPCATSRGAPAASPSSFRFRSSTWRPRST